MIKFSMRRWRVVVVGAAALVGSALFAAGIVVFDTRMLLSAVMVGLLAVGVMLTGVLHRLRVVMDLAAAARTDAAVAAQKASAIKGESEKDARLIEQLRAVRQRLGEVRRRTEMTTQAVQELDSRVVGDFASKLEAIRDELARLEERSIPVAEGVALLAEARAQSFAEAGENLMIMKSLEAQLRTIVEAHASSSDVAQGRHDDVRNLREELSRMPHTLSSSVVQEIDALLQLSNRYPSAPFAPLMGGWAMDAAALHALVQLITDSEPSFIFECGSGASSVWIGRVLKELGCGRLVSLEHLPEYRDKALHALEEEELSAFADIVFTPLVDHQLGSETWSWYDVSSITLRAGSIDVLIVDGPPGDDNIMARYPALPVLRDALASGAFVLLDDVHRADERKIADRWKTEFPELIELGKIGPRTALFQLGES